MRSLPLALLLTTLVSSTPASARHIELDGCRGFSCGSCGMAPARWAARRPEQSAEFAITTRNRKVTLLLTESTVAMQLSDHEMHRISQKLWDKENEPEDNAFANAIKTVVLSSVRALLDHSAECRLRDLDDVEYVSGRLVFTTVNGNRLFDDTDVDDDDVMGAFSERDSRAFVREFHRLKATAPSTGRTLLVR
jgi:hypothetical protein